MQSVEPEKKRVVIIGAGPAGLTAAHELLTRARADFDVTIIEQLEDVGGIARTIAHNRKRFDIGGHRYFSKVDRVNTWLKERLPLQGAPALDDKILERPVQMAPKGPDPACEDRVMLVRRRSSHIFYQGSFIDYPLNLSLSTLRTLGLRTAFEVAFSYLRARIFRRSEQSLEDFYINRFGRRLYKLFFEGYTEKLWGCHPRDLSPDWGAQRVRGVSLLAAVRESLAPGKTSTGADGAERSLSRQLWYPKLGVGQVWQRATEEITQMGGQIELGERIVGIGSDDLGHLTSVTSINAEGRETRYAADYVLSTMPLCDLVSALGDAPSDVADIAAGLPYRAFVIVCLLVPRLAVGNDSDWPTLGSIPPDNWIYVQQNDVRLGRIQFFNNWSPYLLPEPDKHVWVGCEFFCDEGDDLWSLPQDRLVKQAVDDLCHLGILSAHTPIEDACVHREAKAYPAYHGTYGDLDRLVAWLDTHDNLFCLGRNGQHRYNNMDHSMMTGFLAADDILSGRADHSNVWQVNAEAEYHEQDT